MSATTYLVGLWTAPREKLVKANPKALAKKHNIPVHWAEYWLGVRLESGE